MFYLYILENKAGRHYIGISANIEKRLIAHNEGRVRSTRFYKPWIVIYKEQLKDRAEARKREMELKTNHTKREEIFGKYGAIV